MLVLEAIHEEIKFDSNLRLKAKSKKNIKSFNVWVCYAINRTLLPYLQDDEQLRMQRVNRFSYDILVSRVQTKITMPLDGLIFCIANHSERSTSRRLLDDSKVHTLYLYSELTEDYVEFVYENIDFSTLTII